MRKLDLSFKNENSPTPTKKKYVPDKNGYFICEPNSLITNTALCRDHLAIIKKSRLTINEEYMLNNNCAKCSINLKLIKGVSLDNIAELQTELYNRF